MLMRRLQHTESKLIIDSALKVWYDTSKPECYPGTGTTLYDLSGNGNNGTFINGASVIDNALNFDGSNDYIASINNVPVAGAAPRTLSCWLKMTSVTATNKSIISIGGGPDGNLFELLVSGTSSITGHFYGTGYAFGATIAENLSLQWHNLALSYNGAVAYLYCDGSLRAQFTKMLNTTASKLRLGIPTGSQAYNSGKVRQAMLYSRALSAAEIAQNYNAQRSNYAI